MKQYLLLTVFISLTSLLALTSTRNPARAVQKPLAAQVTIRRDTFGIPHILAETEEAMAYGFGYAQAEDHCLQIAEGWVGARGESAKYFSQGVEGDFLLKQFDNVGACRQNFTQLDPLMQKMFRAYAAGVNRYVEQHRNELPAWIPVFDEIDVLANIHESSINSVNGVIRRLQNKYEGKPLPQQISLLLNEFTADAEEAGSNAFAIGPARSVSGKAMLLGNPHLNWSSRYWEAHVTVPGKVNFFGSTLPGLPVLRAGFNEHLGFVQTNNAPDMADVFALKVDPANPAQYVFDGKAMPITKREVAVEIKTADGSLRTEKRSYEYSHLGPIIYRYKDQAFVYRSTQLESYRHFEGFYRLSKAKNLREWMAVMKMNLLNYSNFTYADAAGNILYFWNAQMPKRVDDGTNYELDVPADTSKFLWQSLHPVTDFPQLLNPRGGYTQNCNNPPWFPSLRDPLNPDKYPSYFERGELGLRPQMALEMLESQPKFSLADVQRLKFNVKMLLADRVKPDLIKAIKATANPSEDLQKGLAVLEAWNNQAAATSKGTMLFLQFWDRYANAVKQPFAVAWDKTNPGRTPAGLSDPAAAVKAFAEAVSMTRKTYGSEAVAWGEVNRYRFNGIDLPADGAPGNYGLFRVMRYSPQSDGKRVAGWVGAGKPLVGFGDAWVLTVEFAKPVKAYSILAYGQSADPNSKHSRDQIELYAQHQYKKLWFTEREIKANLERSYRP
ncbi:MAG TPA: penicillin acylase family protein [Blastocatellia bacterium]|nr:penicillin acylase family protein [Blastocatellia bacterium]